MFHQGDLGAVQAGPVGGGGLRETYPTAQLGQVLPEAQAERRRLASLWRPIAQPSRPRVAKTHGVSLTRAVAS